MLYHNNHENVHINIGCYGYPFCRFAYTERAIKSRKSKKDRQYNGQMKMYKKENNDPLNTTQKTKRSSVI